jgi:UDP-N-acetylmuramoyl-tripeptide--D-alanyl-D-alanine ligase
MSFFQPDNLRAVTNGRWLQRPGSDLALQGVGIDSREDLAGKVFVAIKGERFDGHDFVQEAVRSGGLMVVMERDIAAAAVPAHVGVLLVESTRKALGRMALAYRRTLRATKVIAVGGSAGKTTTKLLIHAALAHSMHGRVSPKSFNNDIGVPLTILQAKPNDRYLVVEVGTNHLGEITQLGAMIEPDIAVITSIGREHLEGLGSIDNVAMENAALLAHVRSGGVAIVNADAPSLRKHLKQTASIILFGEASDADLRLTQRGRDDSGWWFEMNERLRFRLALPGHHNAVNALAAVAVARRLGVSDEIISQGLANAEGPPMRMAIEPIGGVTVYNDAYNANPESMIAALQTFAELTSTAKRRLLVLGDMLELGEAAPALHREVGRQILQICSASGVQIHHAAFVGEMCALTAAEVAREWPANRVTLLRRPEHDAFETIAQLVKAGDAILLKGSRGMAMERLLPHLRQRMCGSTGLSPHAVVTSDLAAGRASRTVAKS